MKKIWITIVIVVIVALTISLILMKSKKEPEEIKIGAIIPLTGDNAIYGVAIKKGIDLAVKEINNRGGINEKKLVVVIEDSEANPLKGVNSFKKLITIDEVPMVIGAVFSAVTLAIAPIAEQNKIVLLSPTSSAVELSGVGDYIFRIYPSDSYDGDFLANFAIEELNAKTASVLYIQAASVTAIIKVFKKVFEERGGQILDMQGYSEGEKDFKSHIQKIKNSDPDIIFLPGYLKEMALQLRQLREFGVNKTILSISTFYDQIIFSLASDAANGILFSTPYFDTSVQNPVMQEFIKAYQLNYEESPNIWAGYGYDALNISALAIRNALSKRKITSEKIKEEFYLIRNYPGVTGLTTFDNNGDVVKELRIMKAENGAFVEYRKK